MTASWSNRGIGRSCDSMRIKSPLTPPTVGRRKAKGNSKTVQPLVLVLKSETNIRRAAVLRAFPPVSYGRAKTVVERENATSVSAGLNERAKTIERDRKKHATQGGRQGVSLTVGPMVRVVNFTAETAYMSARWLNLSVKISM